MILDQDFTRDCFSRNYTHTHIRENVMVINEKLGVILDFVTQVCESGALN